MDMRQKIYDAFFGQAIGDAAGVPLEFTSPERDECYVPVTEMIGWGSHHQPAGTWSDDTSMTLATLDALSESGEAPDYDRIMQNFTSWYLAADYTATGEVFDIGVTCGSAIDKYRYGHGALNCGMNSESACGNGGLMRIMPALFWCLAKNGPGVIEHEKSRKVIHMLTALTHAHPRCLVASGLYLAACEELLDVKRNCGAAPSEDVKSEALLKGFARARKVYEAIPELAAELPYFSRIFDGDFAKAPRAEIKSSGYVLHTIEAAVWCFLGTDSYKDCIIRAINLGHDADTVAEVAGGFAGLYYGQDEIPASWYETLLASDMIRTLCDRFADVLGW